MMIRSLAVLTAILLLGTLIGFISEAPVSAQGRQVPFKGGTEKRQDQLAATIRALTARDSDDLTESPVKGGGRSFDLNGGFQNVMLARIDSYGEPVAACITSLSEANNFFGRDLDTGRALAVHDPFESELESTAKRHGMSVEEYRFYSGLASEFAAGNIIASPGSATFNIVNNDGAGEGFNDGTAAFVVGEGGNTGTTRGEQRLNVFNTAAAVWAAFLDSNVPTNVRSQFDPGLGCSGGSGVLGSAGSLNAFLDFPGAEFPGTLYHGALANKRAGSDLGPGSPEMQARFNTDIDAGCLAAGSRFYYGLDNATPSQRINLFVVVLHEIGHGVGFSSFVNGSTGAFLAGFPDIYSRNMWDESVDLYWHQMTNAQRQASALNTSNVFWDGPSVRLASSYLTTGRQAGTGRVALFTPNPLQGGSSISHFSTAASPNLLMEPSITSGLPLNLDLARQVMRDIGWYRDSTADTVADAITSVVPNGNSVAIGEVQTIFWTNTGGFGRNVTIELSIDGGLNYSAIATDIANTGSYSWTVPNSPTSQGRIRVREAGFAAPAGVSAMNFAILSMPSSAPVSVSGRVITQSGRGVSGALVTFVSDQGSAQTVRTNTFGYYRFAELPSGHTYVGSVSARGMTFPTQLLSLADDLDGVDFLGSY